MYTYCMLACAEWREWILYSEAHGNDRDWQQLSAAFSCSVFFISLVIRSVIVLQVFLQPRKNLDEPGDLNRHVSKCCWRLLSWKRVGFSLLYNGHKYKSSLCSLHSQESFTYTCTYNFVIITDLQTCDLQCSLFTV